MYAFFLFQTTKTVIIEDHLDTIQIYSKEMNGNGSCGVRQKEHCSALDTLISSPHLKLEIRVAARAEKLVGYRTSSNTFLVNHELIPLHWRITYRK